MKNLFFVSKNFQVLDLQLTRKLIIIDAAFCVLDKKGSVFIATADAAKQENNLLHAHRAATSRVRRSRENFTKRGK